MLLQCPDTVKTGFGGARQASFPLRLVEELGLMEPDDCHQTHTVIFDLQPPPLNPDWQCVLPHDAVVCRQGPGAVDNVALSQVSKRRCWWQV